MKIFNFLKKDFIIVVYGCLSRSLKVTHKNHQEKIFDQLANNRFNYDAYYFNNHVEEIDGNNVNRFDRNIVKPKGFIEFDQKSIDEKIISKYPHYESFFKRIVGCYGINPVRQSFIESEVSKLLLSKYKSYRNAIVFCSDLWFDKKINLDWLKEDNVVVSDQNPADGYTNGFYFGDTKHISKLLNSFPTLQDDATKDFEYLIKANAEKHQINIKEENFRFLKIRSDGTPAYKMDAERRLSPYIINLWEKLKHINIDYENDK